MRVQQKSVAYLPHLHRCTTVAETRCIEQRILADFGVFETFLGNHLVQAYGTAGSAGEARRVFDAITLRNSFSWNMLAAAYTKNGHLQEATLLLENMPHWDAVSWTPLLVAYAQNRNLGQARRVFFDRMPQRDVISWNGMLSAYAQAGHLQDAVSFFEKMPSRTVVSWTPIIVAYGESGRPWDARAIFDRAPARDVITVNAMLSAYARNGEMREAMLMFRCSSPRSLVSWNSVLSGFAMSGDIGNAKAVLEKIPATNVVSWNAMISALAQNGEVREAASVFHAMPERDPVSFQAAIAMFGAANDLEAVESTFLGFRRHCALDHHRLHPREQLAGWNSLLLAYADCGLGRKAARVFLSMDLEGLGTDRVSWISILDVCARFGFSNLGMALRDEISDSPIDEVVGSCLIAMLGKLGFLEQARQAFENIPQAAVVAWSSMVLAYAENGEYSSALRLFEDMPLHGVLPDAIAFVHVLSSCNHAGMVTAGRRHLRSLLTDYCGLVRVNVDHFTIAVDLHARSGDFPTAVDLIQNMPFQPTDVTWRCLLGACGSQGKLTQAQDAASQLVRNEPGCSSSYILLANSFALYGEEEDEAY